MENIDYSVVIRTTGNAHEKYQRLLDSIAALTPQPKEVIVVLPDGYSAPEERLGWEKILFCPKGMVRQRLEGLAACQTDYALFCDDDITFPSDFVRKLYKPLKEGRGAFSTAPLYSFLPEKGKETLICLLMASAVPTIFHRNTRYVSVLKSTGYSYNRHLDRSAENYYESQSAAWTCFFADTKAFRSLKLEKETWLDAHGYSALDDQTMFYKAWLMGLKMIVVSNAEYEHLDAKTAIRKNRPNVLYSRSFNRFIFWHRFILNRQKTCIGRFIAKIAFLYYKTGYCTWYRFNVLRHHITKEDYRVVKHGFTEAYDYIKTKEYQNLPNIF